MSSLSCPEQLSLPIDGVVRIPLHSRKYPGMFALVDAADAERVNQYRWHPCKRHSGNFVAMGRTNGIEVLMHRFIMDAPHGIEVDHANHDTLDNRRIANLRLCTHSQNGANRRKLPGTAAPYKGVIQRPGRDVWSARIDNLHIGDYDSALDAAIAYDHAAWVASGEFSLLNFPDRLQKPAPRKRSRIRGSGYAGVSFKKSIGKWVARIRVTPSSVGNDRRIHLGYFDTPEAAHEAVQRARIDRG